MLKSKISLKNLPIDLEVEGETQEQLEKALEAALNVAMRSLSFKAYREPETLKQREEVIRTTPLHTTPSAGGVSSLMPTVEKNLERHLSYKGAKKNADYIKIALADLGVLMGTDRGYTTSEIYKHMEDTGGHHKMKDNERPVGAVYQAMKNSNDFIKEGDYYYLKEWKIQDSGLEEPSKQFEVSRLEF